MDHLTHVVIGYKILEACGGDQGAAGYSLVPAIDREPAHFHRVYGHILHNLPRILEAALAALPGNPTRGQGRATYEEKRMEEDREYFWSLLRKAAPLVGIGGEPSISRDRLSAAVALLSHVYVDTFNNPVQAFLPESARCSGQWEFWANVDYLHFRAEFYSDSRIDTFRKMLVAQPVWEARFSPQVFPKAIRDRLSREGAWEKKLNPYALVKAMIIRLGEQADPQIEYSIVDGAVREFLAYLECAEYQRPDRELAFCRELEAVIATCVGQSLK